MFSTHLLKIICDIPDITAFLTENNKKALTPCSREPS